VSSIRPETLSREIISVLEGQDIDYFCSVQDEIAVATWDFEGISRSILASPEDNKIGIGLYLQKSFPTGAYGELREDVVLVDYASFSENVLESYKRAERYSQEDLEIDQARMF